MHARGAGFYLEDKDWTLAIPLYLGANLRDSPLAVYNYSFGAGFALQTYGF